MNDVKIISINVNGLRTRESDLTRFIDEEGENCIYALSDTRLTKDTNIRRIEGYSMLRSDRVIQGPMPHRAATAGGVAILVPSKWTCQQVKINFKGDGIEVVAAIIFPSGQNCQPLKLMSIYNHPGNHFPVELFQEFKDIRFNKNSVNGLIVGDYNCPHMAMGSRTSNEFGNKLIQNLNNENLVFFNNGDPTYYSSASGLPNLLDLAIGEPSTCPIINSCIVRGDIGSDHLPLITSLVFKVKQTRHCKVNLMLWAANVDKDMESIVLTDDLDRNIDNINNIVREAHSKSCTHFSARKRKLPPEIMMNIRLRKMLLKARQTAKTDLSRMLLTKRYNWINNKVKRQIQEYDEEQVEKLAESICDAKCTNKMWKLFNRYKNKCQDIDEPETPLLKPDGDLTSDDQSRCTEFA